MISGVIPAQVLSKAGDVVRDVFRVTTAGSVEQRDSGIKALCQGGDKKQAPLHVADYATERNQNVAWMGLAHVDGPHDRQVRPDRTQKLVDDMLLQGCAILLVWCERVENGIRLFRLDTLWQETGDCTGLRNPRDRNAEFNSGSKQVIQVTLGMAEQRLVGPLIVGGVQHQFGFGCCGHRYGIAGGHGGSGVY